MDWRTVWAACARCPRPVPPGWPPGCLAPVVLGPLCPPFLASCPCSVLQSALPWPPGGVPWSGFGPASVPMVAASVGWGPWRGVLACASVVGVVACAGAGAEAGPGVGGVTGGTGAVGRAGEPRCGSGAGFARVGVEGRCCPRADVGVRGVRFLVGLRLTVGCRRVVPRGSWGCAPASGCVAVVGRCGSLPVSVGGAGLPWSAVAVPCGGALVESVRRSGAPG